MLVAYNRSRFFQELLAKSLLSIEPRPHEMSIRKTIDNTMCSTWILKSGAEDRKLDVSACHHISVLRFVKHDGCRGCDT